MREAASDHILYCKKCKFLGINWHGWIGIEGCFCVDRNEEEDVVLIDIPLNKFMNHPQFKKRFKDSYNIFEGGGIGGIVITDEEFKNFVPQNLIKEYETAMLRKRNKRNT